MTAPDHAYREPWLELCPGDNVSRKEKLDDVDDLVQFELSDEDWYDDVSEAGSVNSGYNVKSM